MTDVTPRVGVVIRTKNRPFFLERALRDVLAQSFSDWHVVVSNDGGDPDEVRRVVDGLSDELAGRVTLSDVVAPGGRCAAANQGIRAVQTPYLVLHDDDDLWHPEFLATTVEWLDTHPDDGGVMVPIEQRFEKLKRGSYVQTGRARLWPELTQITFLDLLQVNRAVPISFLYRRSLHDELGYYDETLEAVEDWDFYLRITVDHHIGFIVGEPLAYWVLRPSARGEAGNSMYALGDIHERYDAIVRDRALRAFVREYGPGLPLMIAGLMESTFARQTRLIRGRQPVRTALRRLRLKLLGRV